MTKDFAYYLSKYLKDHLILERNMSNNTIRSYKKTFELLIDYLINKKNLKIFQINFETITRDIVIEFLNYLEEERKIQLELEIKDWHVLNLFINIA